MKNVLIDFSHYADLCGFGEIARNYSRCLTHMAISDLHFIFILPKKFRGIFGSDYDYIDREDKRRGLRQLGLHIDLWHATDQQFGMRGGDDDTIQLLTIHDANFLYEKHGMHKWRHTMQLKWRVRHSHHLTTISHFVLDDLQRHGFVQGKPIEVIYNGISNQLGKEQRKPAFIKDEQQPFFFTIGQIREKKNFHTLIPMMQHFPQHHLYICGDDHFDYADTLRSKIEAESTGRVSLTGKISDAEKRWLYAHCEAFLFPSRLEGFGIPVLEAMQHRCKVFASRLTSLPEVCATHATYWDDFSPDAMAMVVREGLQSWHKNSDEARLAADYSLSFSYEHYARQYVDLYRRLLSRKL